MAFTGVRRRPPPSASRANTIRWPPVNGPVRGWMSPKLSPGPGLRSRCGGRVAGRSSAAWAAVTGRRQRFVLHGSK